MLCLFFEFSSNGGLGRIQNLTGAGGWTEQEQLTSFSDDAALEIELLGFHSSTVLHISVGPSEGVNALNLVDGMPQTTLYAVEFTTPVSEPPVRASANAQAKFTQTTLKRPTPFFLLECVLGKSVRSRFRPLGGHHFAAI
jgi:hypothetical protein